MKFSADRSRPATPHGPTSSQAGLLEASLTARVRGVAEGTERPRTPRRASRGDDSGRLDEVQVWRRVLPYERRRKPGGALRWATRGAWNRMWVRPSPERRSRGDSPTRATSFELYWIGWSVVRCFLAAPGRRDLAATTDALLSPRRSPSLPAQRGRGRATARQGALLGRARSSGRRAPRHDAHGRSVGRGGARVGTRVVDPPPFSPPRPGRVLRSFPSVVPHDALGFSCEPVNPNDKECA